MKKALIIISTLVIVLTLGLYILVTNNQKVKSWYYYKFMYTHFNSGDKMYFAILDPKNDTVYFNLLRLVTPITSDDIDAMKIDTDEKQLLKLKLNPTLKPYLIKSSDKIVSAGPDYYVGKYLGHSVFPSYIDNSMYEFTDVDAIYPDPRILHIDNVSLLLNKDLPNGYKWANNIYYFLSINMVKK